MLTNPHLRCIIYGGLWNSSKIMGGVIKMNIFKKAFCRVSQFGFRTAMPILPYREPKILGSLSDIAPTLKEMGV